MIKNIKNNILNNNSSVATAIKILQESRYKTVIIISKDLKVLGTITDGDIRRGLLVGMSLSAKCHEVMNKKPKIALENDNLRINEILKNIKKKSIKNGVDPKITSRIWKSMIWSYIEFQKKNFKKK